MNDILILMLLFLLPPSCMVAPIGKTANKFNFPTSFSSTIQSNNQRTLLPSVNIFSNTEMDHSTGTNPVIINDVRGRSPHIHKNQSRDSSMSSMVSSTIYYERMELNNSMDIDSDPLQKLPLYPTRTKGTRQFVSARQLRPPTTQGFRMETTWLPIP